MPGVNTIQLSMLVTMATVVANCVRYMMYIEVATVVAIGKLMICLTISTNLLLWLGWMHAQFFTPRVLTAL